jgi:tetratricopeptide (TPR) repeat protein
MFDDAVALYRRRIDADPRGARKLQSELDELYESHAESLMLAGKSEDAIRLYRTRIAKAPTDVSLRVELAELHGARATEVAIAELKQLLELAPSSVEGWAALAERYDWKGDLGQSVKAYQEASRLAPADRAIRRALAQRLLWSDRNSEAIAQYELLVSGGSDEDREALVEVLIDADRGAESLQVARTMPASLRRAHLLGLAALAAGEYEVALPELTAWTQQEAGDLRAWRALLDCATAMDDPDLALNALRHVQALERRGAGRAK